MSEVTAVAVVSLLAASLQQGQSSRRVAGSAGHENSVAGLRTAASKRNSGNDVAHQLHADHRLCPARRVSADQRHGMLVRGLEQSFRKVGEPRLIGFDKRQRKRHPPWPAAHCRNIGEVHRQCTITDIGRSKIDRIMDAFNKGIDGDDEVMSRFRRNHRAIVTDTDDHTAVLPFSRKETTDDLELVHAVSPRPRCQRRSLCRICPAARSSTALTYLWPSTAPNRFVRFTASFITTRYGISMRDWSS